LAPSAFAWSFSLNGTLSAMFVAVMLILISIAN